MNRVIGLIFGNTRSDLLQGLTQDRPIVALPFGGKYRLLDFALSSFINSGIRTVGLITPQNYRPVLDHTGAGKDWYLDRKSGGLFILPGVIHGLSGGHSRFLMQNMTSNLEFLEKDSAENVVITYCNQVYNIDYQEALDFHELKKADVTLIYKESEQEEDLQRRLLLSLNVEHKVNTIAQNWDQEEPLSEVPYFVDMLIIRRELFIELIERYKSIETADLIDAIRENIDQIEVYAHPTKAYIGRINSIEDYFRCNMDLLKPEVSQELFQSKNQIYTKVRDNPPSLYCSTPKVRNSLLSCDCTLDGEVEHSIISRGVIIKPGAKVKNCILMQKCIIGENAVLENVILDKFVEVKEGNVLVGRRESPLVISKKSIV
ncbi:glucose-1-phosphate adenylyltransferase subunit GlgD [Desulfitobacterium sp. AusDCA]|uniref:glucose-1-phosphate adenylyltransferase subunit GlgD n=1 Tax=Desulfitobacterium sp. AusDCA TaxID=3240383 RepID=UPI003DA72578